MHVGGLNLYTLPKGVDETTFFENLGQILSYDGELRSPFAEKIKVGPLGALGKIRWEQEDDLDMDYHVRRSALPSPGRYRELFALVPFRGLNGYVKLGKFLQPYGWRLPDDDSFIRGPLGFAFSAPDLGIEVGIEPGPWSVHLAAVNGNSGIGDDNRSKKLTLLAMRRFGSAQIGLSGAYDDVSGGNTIATGGLLAGLNFGRLTLLAEGDIRRTRQNEQLALNKSFDTYVAYGEVDLMIVRGLNLKYVHDWIDPNRSILTDRRTRQSLGIEYVPIPFVQLRAFMRHRDGPPQVPGSRDKQVDVELHLYF